MQSVPRAVATGSRRIAGIEVGKFYPVATALGTDLISTQDLTQMRAYLSLTKASTSCKHPTS